MLDIGNYGSGTDFVHALQSRRHTNSPLSMNDLAQQLSDALAILFAEFQLDPKHATVTRADRPDLGDFQCNGAMAAAKGSGRAPRDIASAIAAKWAAPQLADAPVVAGPGFLNFRVSEAALSARARQIAEDPRFGAPKVPQTRRVLIDYGGPNVAKPMHVGHLRASIIGDSLKRIFRFRGDQVWGDAHFGDWGFQMGLLIVALEDELGGLGEKAKLDARLSDAHARRSRSACIPPPPLARKKTRRSASRARKATLALQEREPVHPGIWRAMHDLSMAALKREFSALGVDFDLWNGESDADPLIPEMIEELRAKNLLEHDQNAQILRVARPEDKRPIPPLLVISSEGSSMYGTTDLATIVQREREIDPDLYLYVVDQRQADHFDAGVPGGGACGLGARRARWSTSASAR